MSRAVNIIDPITPSAAAGAEGVRNNLNQAAQRSLELTKALMAADSAAADRASSERMQSERISAEQQQQDAAFQQQRQRDDAEFDRQKQIIAQQDEMTRRRRAEERKIRLQDQERQFQAMANLIKGTEEDQVLLDRSQRDLDAINAQEVAALAAGVKAETTEQGFLKKMMGQMQDMAIADTELETGTASIVVNSLNKAYDDAASVASSRSTARKVVSLINPLSLSSDEGMERAAADAQSLASGLSRSVLGDLWSIPQPSSATNDAGVAVAAMARPVAVGVFQMLPPDVQKSYTVEKLQEDAGGVMRLAVEVSRKAKSGEIQQNDPLVQQLEQSVNALADATGSPAVVRGLFKGLENSAATINKLDSQRPSTTAYSAAEAEKRRGMDDDLRGAMQALQMVLSSPTSRVQPVRPIDPDAVMTLIVGQYGLSPGVTGQDIAVKLFDGKIVGTLEEAAAYGKLFDRLKPLSEQNSRMYYEEAKKLSAKAKEMEREIKQREGRAARRVSAQQYAEQARILGSDADEIDEESGDIFRKR